MVNSFLKASDKELMELSKVRCLSLNLAEIKAIQSYFAGVGREPSEAELETFAQTWSEHCCHKTFKGVFLTSEGEVKNLLKETIARATKELNKDWCFSVFVDNAGIIDFESDFALSFKVETHNHPSALEPFGGAATGVGGVIRDTLGVWATPLYNTDVLCFGNLDEKNVPKGVKSPSYLFTGVVSGIASYGNNIGLATVNGSVFFDESYTGNPLVFCGNVGLVEKNKYVRATCAGDAVVIIGGRTGRDGIHGVTFASIEISEDASQTSRSVVQIGDPIEEEKIIRAIVRVRDEWLASGITDLGGGGFSSAIPEMAERSDCGVRVDLTKAPLKYPMKQAWEIWVSESQERMLLSIPQKNLMRALEIFEEEEVEAVVLGEFTSDKRLQVSYNGKNEVDLSLDFLFTLPSRKSDARFTPKKFVEPVMREENDYTNSLKKILGMPNVCSKQNVVIRYDTEIKGGTVLKPFHGQGKGPGDASVLKPLPNSWKGFALSNGLNPEYGKISVYDMAANAIDEAIRNNAAVGGRRFALLDNFSWGSPEKPENAFGLVEACRACYDYAKAFDAPFISGKDSLYNEFAGNSITPTLLVSCIGILPDVRKAVSMDFKQAGNSIYLLGETKNELGASHYYKLHGELGANVPRVDGTTAKKTVDALAQAMDAGLIRSCHDLSEGGLAVALAESCFAGDLGAEINLADVACPADAKKNHVLLFSESATRFILEVDPRVQGEVEKIFRNNGLAFKKIGVVSEKTVLVIKGLDGKNCVKTSVAQLREAWQAPLSWYK